ncbi:4'-phosphopantetheinyl transferase family protein [Anaerotignum sp.]|uniref:4'-phosphopantetheinyl transferase family protein n=1 Tax=Anaerotignum sp. TaxID=2039241 RepID=UPI002714FF8D|nr:4'-phosphopantetheinyl transferase superfamily protein [Anaerotignum sp.]
MVELLIMDADELKDSEKFETAMELVGEQRRNKVERLFKEESKRLSLAAGLLLRYAFFSVNQAKLYTEIEVTANGKPYLPNKEYYFSLSHSGRYAICTFSKVPVGCDIEKTRDKLPRTTKIFSIQEEKEFITLEEKEKRQIFFQLWTCKESITKLIGKGIAYPFESFSVLHENQVKESVFIDERYFYLKSFHQIENYAISVCTETSKITWEIKKMNWYNLIKIKNT